MVPRAVSLWSLLCRYDSLKFKRPAFFYFLSPGIKVCIISQGLTKGYLVEDPGPTAGSQPWGHHRVSAFNTDVTKANPINRYFFFFSYYDAIYYLVDEPNVNYEQSKYIELWVVCQSTPPWVLWLNENRKQAAGAGFGVFVLFTNLHSFGDRVNITKPQQLVNQKRGVSQMFARCLFFHSGGLPGNWATNSILQAMLRKYTQRRFWIK